MYAGDKGNNQSIGDIAITRSKNVTVSQTIIISAEEVKTRKLIITSPYKGLRKFEIKDKDHFFGRDQFLEELAKELEQTNLVLLWSYVNLMWD